MDFRRGGSGEPHIVLRALGVSHSVGPNRVSIVLLVSCARTSVENLLARRAEAGRERVVQR